MHASRRTFLGVAGAAATVALGADRFGASLLSSANATDVPLPSPDASGIEHVVVVMMENRSFDHLLGWLPGADGKQAGLSYVDRYGVRHATHHMTVPNNCGFYDPDHSYEGGRIQYDGGRCDGFLRSGQNDVSAIGYYEQADLPFLGQAATQWTTFDRYFAPTMSSTYPNRFYMHAAMTDRLTNTYDTFAHATIWDRLKSAGVSGTYYYSDIPFAALLGTHGPTSMPFLPSDKFTTSFMADAAAGTLPAVSFVDPQFVNEDQGLSNDDHPHADLRAGEAFLNKIYDAVRTSPVWDKTVLVITFDEWGGFFDHVRPTTAPDVSPKTALRGFRVPTVVISPLARRGHVGHNVYDHTSILKMIEWRWGLKPLTPRDKAARNIAEVLDFSNPSTDSPAFQVDETFVPVACTATSEGTTANSEERRTESAEWPALRRIALSQGWTLPS